MFALSTSKYASRRVVPPPAQPQRAAPLPHVLGVATKIALARNSRFPRRAACSRRLPPAVPSKAAKDGGDDRHDDQEGGEAIRSVHRAASAERVVRPDARASGRVSETCTQRQVRAPASGGSARRRWPRVELSAVAAGAKGSNPHLPCSACELVVPRKLQGPYMWAYSRATGTLPCLAIAGSLSAPICILKDAL